MPEINAEELTTRHNQYLRDVRVAIDHMISRKHTEEAILEAQKSYAEWFAERGVILTFEDLP